MFVATSVTHSSICIDFFISGRAEQKLESKIGSRVTGIQFTGKDACGGRVQERHIIRCFNNLRFVNQNVTRKVWKKIILTFFKSSYELFSMKDCLSMSTAFICTCQSS